MSELANIVFFTQTIPALTSTGLYDIGRFLRVVDLLLIALVVNEATCIVGENGRAPFIMFGALIISNDGSVYESSWGNTLLNKA